MTVPGATPYLVNIAQDITINEMYVDLFGFDRNNLRNWERYCWIQTCFKNPQNIKRNENFTYYLKELIKNGSDSVNNGDQKTLDMHGNAGSNDGTMMPGQGETDEEKKAKERLAKELAEELSASDLNKIKGALPKDADGSGQGAGTMSGSYEFIIKRKEARARLKIAKLIAKLKRTVAKMTEVDVETFVAKDRRFQSILGNHPDMHLPGNATYEKPKKDKLLVALYIDISGSCVEFIPLFKKILLAFMEEKESLITIAHTFDTSVERVTYDTHIRGGGGTYFHIIEENNLKLEAEIGRYPDAVIIITDGEGNKVVPKMPKRWIWLLTPYNMKEYINSASKWYLTKDVVFE
jgi:predicted metal-dependent peptidase